MSTLPSGLTSQQYQTLRNLLLQAGQQNMANWNQGTVQDPFATPYLDANRKLYYGLTYTQGLGDKYPEILQQVQQNPYTTLRSYLDSPLDRYQQLEADWERRMGYGYQPVGTGAGVAQAPVPAAAATQPAAQRMAGTPSTGNIVPINVNVPGIPGTPPTPPPPPGQPPAPPPGAGGPWFDNPNWWLWDEGQDWWGDGSSSGWGWGWGLPYNPWNLPVPPGGGGSGGGGSGGGGTGGGTPPQPPNPNAPSGASVLTRLLGLMGANNAFIPQNVDAQIGAMVGVPIGWNPQDVPISQLLPNRAINVLRNALTPGGVGVPGGIAAQAAASNLQSPDLRGRTAGEYLQDRLRGVLANPFQGESFLQNSGAINQLLNVGTGLNQYAADAAKQAGQYELQKLAGLAGNLMNPTALRDLFFAPVQMTGAGGGLPPNPDRPSLPPERSLQFAGQVPSTQNPAVGTGPLAVQDESAVPAARTTAAGGSAAGYGVPGVEAPRAMPAQAQSPWLQGFMEQYLTREMNRPAAGSPVNQDVQNFVWSELTNPLGNQYVEAFRNQVYQPQRDRLLEDLSRRGVLDSSARLQAERELYNQQFADQLLLQQRAAQQAAAGLGLQGSALEQRAREAENQRISQLLGLGSGLAGQGFDQSLANAQLRQQAGLSNQAAQLQAALANQSTGLQAALNNQRTLADFAPLALQQQAMAGDIWGNMANFGLQRALGIGQLGQSGFGQGLQGMQALAGTTLGRLQGVQDMLRQPNVDLFQMELANRQLDLAALDPFLRQQGQLLDFVQGNIGAGLDLAQLIQSGTLAGRGLDLQKYGLDIQKYGIDKGYPTMGNILADPRTWLDLIGGILNWWRR